MRKLHYYIKSYQVSDVRFQEINARTVGRPMLIVERLEPVA